MFQIRIGRMIIEELIEGVMSEFASLLSTPNQTQSSRNVAQFEFDASEVLNNLYIIENIVPIATEKAMEEIVNELARIASEATPIDTGTLRRSVSTAVKHSGGDVTGEVWFSAKEGDTNYALIIHEENYNLGDQSRMAPGAVSWSGKHYDVGNKYLERPLKGESEAFMDYVAKAVRKAIEKRIVRR